MDAEAHPQIIECEIRLHTAVPDGAAAPETADAERWARTAVGEPVAFQARADPAAGSWNGPLSPGVSVAAPVALDDPWWTVRLPGSHGVPIRCGGVGRPLAVGEPFTLAAADLDRWTRGVVFDGHVVTD